MGSDYLGEFEHLVLLAIARLGGEAYGVTIRCVIVDRAERGVSFGSLYSTLRRLHAKGFIDFDLVSPGAPPGGRPRRMWRLSTAGEQVIYAAQRRMRRMSEGLGGEHGQLEVAGDRG